MMLTKCIRKIVFFAYCCESGVNGMECNRKLKENFYLLNSGDSGEKNYDYFSLKCVLMFVRLSVCSREKNVLLFCFFVAVNK